MLLLIPGASFQRSVEFLNVRLFLARTDKHLFQGCEGLHKPFCGLGNVFFARSFAQDRSSVGLRRIKRGQGPRR